MLLNKRRLFLMMLALMVILAACSSDSEGETPTTATGGETPTTATGGETPTDPGGPQYGGTLNLSLGEDFITFHPYFDVSTGQFKPIFFEAPIRISDDGDFEPWLAESWEESADGMSLTLHMRSGSCSTTVVR